MGRLVSIDILRGAAALAVVAEHLPNWAPGGWREHPFFFLGLLFEYGYLGVPLFIVISGFCIHQTASRGCVTTGEYHVSWLAYWARRTWRLYPPYVVAIAFSVGVAWLLGSSPTTEGVFWMDLLLHLTMLHNLTAEYATGLGNGAFWSLGTEEHLYLLYIPLLAMIVRFGWARTVVIGLIVCVAWRLFALSAGSIEVWPGYVSLGSWWFWAFKFWLFWILGALAVDAHHGLVKLPRAAYSPMVAGLLLVIALLLNRNLFEFLASTQLGGTALLKGQLVALGLDAQVLLHDLGEIAFGGFCFCLINRMVRGERSAPTRATGAPARLLATAGLWSYSIYLTHVPALKLLYAWMPVDAAPLGWMLAHVTGLIVAVGVGLVFHRAVERYFLARPAWLPR